MVQESLKGGMKMLAARLSLKAALIVLSFGLLLLGGSSLRGAADESVVPQGIIVSPPGYSEQLAMNLWTEGEQYYPGGTVQIHFKVNQAAYVYLYDIDSTGQVTLIYPNGYARENHLGPGEHQLPDRDSYSLVADGPPGREYLQGIALLQPIPLVGLSASGSLDKEAFPLLGQSIEKVKPQVQQMIEVTVAPGQWAAAWTSFQIVSPQATLVIRSQPNGALVYVGDRLRGQTPLKLTVDPGKIQITLVKDGYRQWSETVTLKAQAEAELEAELQTMSAPEPPPIQPAEQPFLDSSPKTDSLAGGHLLSGWTINFGLHPSGTFSLGLDLGFSPFMGLGGSLAFTGQDVPDYFDIGSPYTFTRERVYNAGPELEGDLHLRLPLSPSFALQFGGGIASQAQAHIAAPSSSEIIDVSSIEAKAIRVKPNGYRETKIYLAASAGFVITLASSSFELGYHTRRGWVLGFGGTF